VDNYLPCHCLNVFIPLVDMTTDLGPTELRPASHFLTRDLNKLYLAAFFKKKLLPPEAPLLNRGSVLMVLKCVAILPLVVVLILAPLVRL
jgi:hypothetical protein